MVLSGLRGIHDMTDCQNNKKVNFGSAAFQAPMSWRGHRTIHFVTVMDRGNGSGPRERGGSMARIAAKVWRVAGACILTFGAATASATDVAIRYQLVTDFAGAETVNGRIVVTVTNRSAHELSDLTLRLADPAQGRITGPVQEELELAAGETRRLEGDFVLNVAALSPGRELDWIVVFSDADGFAQQELVRGESPPRPADFDRAQPGT
jgi:hypothetical protein